MLPIALPAGPRRRRHAVASLAAVVLLSGYAAVTVFPAIAAPTLISQGKPVSASSVENAGTPASAAVDGDTGTRWSSAFSDPQWIRVDLGATATVEQVVLRWEAAYATSYQIQTSTDGSTWTDIYSTTTGAGGVETLNVTGSGRYIRMHGTQRATGYGYSLWEFQIYGQFAVSECSTTNSAQGKPATASSVEHAGTPANAAVDGNTATRWSSQFSDPQWIQVDLGTTQEICSVVLRWEAAYARSFQIQTSTDGSTWTPIYSTTTGTGGVQTLTVTGSGRYVRMHGTQRATAWGYSLWEFAIHTAGTPPTTPPPGGGDLGPNVIIFDPSMPSSTIQSRLDTIFREMESNQFGSQRYQLFFKPGTYSGLNAQIGFYTSISGLGLNPGDVRINGDITVDAGWFGGNSTQNFWRSAENLSIYPVNGVDRWAVSQAAPFRRMDVHGGMTLASPGCGWASGGYIADSRVSGSVNPCSQQQWYTRDSNIGGWTNGVWNMVFSGVVGAPGTSFPNPPYTTLATTPVSREKPYLYQDSGGNYRVFVPSLRLNAQGASWPGTPGTSLPLSQFYVAKPDDSAATLNAALASGLNLLFTPGIYHVDQTLHVTRPDTVVLGLGYATLIPDNGVVPMKVADVDGVRIASLLFDAGPVNSPILLEVGPSGSSAAHAANPISLHDVFFRVGGAGPGKNTTSLVVNSHHTLIDHTWVWRADHGAGVGWTVNPADTGVIVNGDNVTALGLFVEHYQKYQVIWNGNGGRTIFFQNEMPYDPPSQAAWRTGANGYAAYKVADHVTTHEGWGMGSYCVFNADPSIHADRGFEAPGRSGVRFHSLLTVSLGGVGVIDHVINNTGPPTAPNTTPSTVVNYP